MSSDEIEVLSVDTEDPDAIRAWEALAGRAASSFFQSPTWVRAWHEVLAPDATVELLIAADMPHFRGALPVAEHRRRLHRLLPLRLPYVTIAGSGSGSADGLEPLADSPGLSTALLQTLILRAGRRSILLDYAPTNVVRVLTSAGHAWRGNAVRAPYLILDSAAPADSAWSRSVRKDTARMERRLHDLGVELDWVEPGDSFAAAVDSLASLHESRWRHEGLPGQLSLRYVRFLQRLGELATPGFYPVVGRLVQQGEPVAALMCFRAPRRWAYYQSGWSPQWSHYGVGRVLVAAAIRRAHTDGADVFDFLRGPEPYKYRFGAVDRELNTVVVTSSASGRLLLARERAADRRRVGRGRSESDGAD